MALVLGPPGCGRGRGGDAEALSVRSFPAAGVRLAVPKELAAQAAQEVVEGVEGVEGGPDTPGPLWRMGEPPLFAVRVQSPVLALEIVVTEDPGVPMPALARALERRLRLGASYQARGHDEVLGRGGHRWSRTWFGVGEAAARPAGVEYTTRAGGRVYTVTLRGPAERVRRLAGVMAPGLAPGAPGAEVPSAPQDAAGRFAKGGAPMPRAARRAAEVAVVVMAADVDHRGRARVRATGSGAVVSADGAVLGTLHVLLDERGHRLHDLFFIGRAAGVGQVPDFLCAGRPADGVIDEAADLALIRCDRGLDADGAPWSAPAAAPPERASGYQPEPGGRLYAAGFAEGWGGELGWLEGAFARAPPGSLIDRAPGLWRTSAEIAPGLSGGPVVDATGAVIGIAAAYRLRADVSAAPGPAPAVERVGLVRPIDRAEPLIERAKERAP